MVIGLDIGTGFVKAVSAEKRVMFPSVYVQRYNGLWSDDAPLEAVGEKAIELMRYPNAEVYRPIKEGRFQDKAVIALAADALKRLEVVPPAAAVIGVPWITPKIERERVRKILTGSDLFHEVAIFPQPLGTVAYMGFKSMVVVDIGQGTTDALAIEWVNGKPKYLGGFTDTVAFDTVIDIVKNDILRNFGLEVPDELIRDLLLGGVERIVAWGPSGRVTVRLADVEKTLEVAKERVSRRLAYRVKELLTSLPPGVECINRVVVSGGGAYVFRKALEESLNADTDMPDDPVFANAIGFYKIASELFGKQYE